MNELKLYDDEVFGFLFLMSEKEGFYTAQEKILERFGKTFDWSLMAKMMRKKAIKSAHIFIEESGLTDLLNPEAFLKECEDMLQKLFPTCDLMPVKNIFASSYLILHAIYLIQCWLSFVACKIK